MWSKVWIVVFCMYIAKGTQNLIKFDEEILKKLEIISRIDSYDQFELFNKYQCAIECLKDKNNCAGYSFDQTNNTCSLFEDSNKIIDKEALEWRKKFPSNNCEKIKCKPDAVCIDEDEPRCVCLNGDPTPDDCDKIEIGVWAEYNDWSICSVTCGEGYQYRKRECLSSKDANEKILSKYCLGKEIDIRSCEVTTCPIYGPWSLWTPCSTFCGIGVKQRNRSCIPPGSSCGNYTFEQRACGEANCQRVIGIKETEANKYSLKGYLAIREGDILCVANNNSATAKHMADLVCKSIGLSRGAQYAVLNPIGNNSTCYSGIVCDGSETSFFDCKFDRTQISTKMTDRFAIITRCIVDGGFSSWSSWSNCTKPCGTGETTRIRTCTFPKPSILEAETIGNDLSLAGMNCTGEYLQMKNCNNQKC